MARHPGRAMACQTLSPQLLQPSKAALYYWKGTFRKLATACRRLAAVGCRPQQKGVPPIQQIECACPCCALYTHSRAAKRPLAASLPATPDVGAFAFAGTSLCRPAVSHRRCLIVFDSLRGAANNSSGERARRALSLDTSQSWCRVQSSLRVPVAANRTLFAF